MTVPETWYTYPYPSPIRPSSADFSQENVAPMVEFFEGVLGVDRSRLQLEYQVESGPINVTHPLDRDYQETPAPSTEMVRYEEAAKRSAILRLFEENSPANIRYFNEES